MSLIEIHKIDEYGYTQQIQQAKVNFTCYANIINYFPYISEQIDIYSTTFIIHIKTKKLQILGNSQTKSKLISVYCPLIFNFLEADENVDHITFICKLPQLNPNEAQLIIEKTDNILKIGNTKNLYEPEYYQYELYSDWNGSGENLYDHCRMIKDDIIQNIINTTKDPEYADLIVSIPKNTNSNIIFKINESADEYQQVYDLKVSGLSKKDSSAVNYKCSFADIYEIYKNKNKYFPLDIVSFYFHENHPIILKLINKMITMVIVVI